MGIGDSVDGGPFGESELGEIGAAGGSSDERAGGPAGREAVIGRGKGEGEDE